MPEVEVSQLTVAGGGTLARAGGLSCKGSGSAALVSDAAVLGSSKKRSGVEVEVKTNKRVSGLIETRLALVVA